MRMLYWLAIVGLTLWAFANPSASSAQAEFEVDTEVDAVDGDPGDGVCETGDGDCSLRSAIQEANALPSDDSIVIPEGIYVLTIPGTDDDSGQSGDLDVLGDVVITGAGSAATVVDGGHADRVFHVLPGVAVRMEGLTVRKGWATGPSGPSGEGGGIYNQGSLTAEDLDIFGNTAEFAGGGLSNPADATLKTSKIRGNVAPNGGAIGNSLGGADNRLAIIDSVVADNRDDFGGSRGGIFVPTAITEIVRSSIVNNVGVGVMNGNERQLTIEESTIANNVNAGRLGEDDGGAIAAIGPVIIRNATISGNSANGHGGGITGGGPLTMNNVTLVNNVADADGNGDGNGGAIYWPDGPDRPEIANSLIAGNSVVGGEAKAECYGLVISLGHNLFGSSTCSSPAPGDIVSDQTLIGPLADNGGPTQTHALLEGSPAIDAGNPVQPGSGGTACQPADQRGVSRPRGNACDIGAYESAFAQAAPTRTTAPQEVPELGGRTQSRDSASLQALAAGAGGLALAILGAQLTRRAFRERT